MPDLNLKIDLVNLLILIVALVNTIYGLIVYLRNRKDRTNLYFFILTLAVSFWDLAMFGYRAVSDHQLAVGLSRVLYLAASTIPLSFLYFVCSFSYKDFRISANFRYLLFLPFLASCLISISPGYLISDVVFRPGQESLIVFNQILHVLYALYIIGYFFTGYVILFKKYLRSDGSARLQTVFILIGTAVSTTIGVFTNLILLLIFNQFYLNWLGQIGTVVMIVAISYAILKHHLFNIRIIAVELFTSLLWLFIFIRTITASDGQEELINGTLLVLTVIVGLFLIRGVRQEVRQRERIELLADDLEKANTRLTDLNRQKSEFVSFATHQLRAPLTAMKGYGSLLLEGDMGKISEEALEGVRRIYDSTNTLVNIVDDYLNISRIELGTMKYVFETIDLRVLVQDTLAELKPNIEKTGLEFVFEVDEEGADWRITADRDKLKQVIINIVDNSLKYTPSGSVTVRLSFDRAQHKFVLIISDTGVGIAPEVLPLLFRKFSRAENASKTNIRGTGLGLFVAKEIIEAHHGSIRAESSGEGRGASFVVELEPFTRS